MDPHQVKYIFFG